MLVTIERVERRQGKNGSYHLVHLGEGRKLYCWDAKLAGELVPGAVYEIEAKEGQFPRLLAARPLTTSNGAQAGQEASLALVTAQERLEALRLAMSAIGQVRPQDVPQVIEAASAILRWLKLGDGGQG